MSDTGERMETGWVEGHGTGRATGVDANVTRECTGVEVDHWLDTTVEIVGTETEATRVGKTLFDLKSGQRFGRYRILDRLGSGGMGVVYSAFDTEDERTVALKVAHFSGHPREGRRLLREAQSIARVRHENVVAMYEAGTIEARSFVAMQWIQGKTMRDWLDSKTPEIGAVLSAFLQSGEALQAVHNAGLVHRDFKPDNVLIDGNGRVFLTDFGLACIRGTEAVSNIEFASGTPAYMAPEQYEGEAAEPASDQFAYCVALYTALYGRQPFAGRTREELRKNVTGGQLQLAPLRQDLPVRIREAILRGLSRLPDRRWPSMTALVDTLRGGSGCSVAVA